MGEGEEGEEEDDDVDHEIEVPVDRRAEAIAHAEAVRVLNEVSEQPERGGRGDWRAAAWMLERRVPEGWGGWHPHCMPDRVPHELVVPGSSEGRAAAEYLGRFEDWQCRCRVCGEPL